MLLTNNKTVAHSPRARMAEQLASPEGKTRCAERQWIVAAANGWLKQILRLRAKQMAIYLDP